jgi:hypothetical protein
VAALLRWSGPPGAPQAGVEGDGVGVQVLVDQVEVGAELRACPIRPMNA